MTIWSITLGSVAAMLTWSLSVCCLLKLILISLSLSVSLHGVLRTTNVTMAIWWWNQCHNQWYNIATFGLQKNNVWMALRHYYVVCHMVHYYFYSVLRYQTSPLCFRTTTCQSMRCVELLVVANVLSKHHLHSLTHWGRDNMAGLFQTTFSNPISCMKMC